MTPSGWHDDARNRDAGHDEMQIAVFDWVKDHSRAFGHVETEFEMPLYHRGQIIAWCDIGQRVFREGVAFPAHLFIWEIKPKIYSVGAVVRQCIALQQAAEKACTNEARCLMAEVKVFPVVMVDDPKLSMLRHVFHAHTWDGERLS